MKLWTANSMKNWKLTCKWFVWSCELRSTSVLIGKNDTVDEGLSMIKLPDDMIAFLQDSSQLVLYIVISNETEISHLRSPKRKYTLREYYVNNQKIQSCNKIMH